MAEQGSEPNPAGAPLDLAALRARFPEVAFEPAGADGWPVLRVPLQDWRALAQHLRDAEGFNLLLDVTAVDWPNRPEGRFDLVAHFRRLPTTGRVRCVAIVNGAQSAPSLQPLFEAANWGEREVYDLFGIRFEGHPDLRRILLPDDWEGHPLRRDYPIEGPRVLDPASKYAH